MDIISNIFSGFRPSNVTESKANAGAKRVRQTFNRFQHSLKEGSRRVEARSKAVAALSQFEQANPDMTHHLNVAAKNDIFWAYLILFLTFAFEAVLSYKGSQFFIETFINISSPFFISFVAVALAAFAIKVSITLRHFSIRYQKGPRALYYAIVTGAYLFVFIIPVLNICEGLHTTSIHDPALPPISPLYQTMNLLIVLITLGVHITLINLHEVFFKTKNEKKAARERSGYTKTIASSEKAIAEHSVQYETTRQGFTEAVRDFMPMYQNLRQSNPDAAQRVINQFDIFLIWFANRVYGHAVLPLHANELGQVEASEPFTPELRNLANLMDHLDSVTVSINQQNGRQDAATTIEGHPEPPSQQPINQLSTNRINTPYDQVFAPADEHGSSDNAYDGVGVNPENKFL